MLLKSLESELWTWPCEILKRDSEMWPGIKLVKTAKTVSIWGVPAYLLVPELRGSESSPEPTAAARRLRLRRLPVWRSLSRAKSRITKLDGEKKKKSWKPKLPLRVLTLQDCVILFDPLLNRLLEWQGPEEHQEDCGCLTWCLCGI